MQPYFSVVIPTYERPRLLREAVESVLDQSFSDFELLVVDDDPGASGRAGLAGISDDRLRYMLNDRGHGGAGARNAGIQKASGRWTAFLDDDDVWLPEKLARQHQRVATDDEDLGLVYSGSAVFDFDRRSIVSERKCLKEGWLRNDLLFRNYVGGMSTVAIRTDVLRSIGGFDENFPALQDVDLFVRAAGQVRVGFVDETLALIRKEGSDRITRNLQRKLDGNLLFWRKYREEIEASPRLMHRTASRIFIFAVLTGDGRRLLQSLPWTLAGLFVDPRNLREVGAKLIREYRQLLSGQSKRAEGRA